MSNHVKSIVTVLGKDEDVKEFFDRIRQDPENKNNSDDEVDFDFNRIIPTPPEIKLPEGESGTPMDVEEWVKYFCHLNNYPLHDYYYGQVYLKPRPPMSRRDLGHDFRPWDERKFKLFQHFIKAVEATGFIDWHGWKCHHWGTKWNCYDSYVEGNVLTFQTAWSFPRPVFEKIAEMFPNLTFEIKFADEDFGNNCNEFKIIHGQIMEPIGFENKDKAFEFACDIWGYDPEELRKEYAEEEANE